MIMKRFISLFAAALVAAGGAAAQDDQVGNMDRRILPVEIPNSHASTTIIMSSDTATISRSAHTLAAQTGTADDLCQVVTTGLAVGHQTILKADSGDTITIKNGGSCNITTDTGADLILSGAGRAFVYVTAAGVDASLGGGSAAAITSLSDLSALTAASPAGTVRTLGAAMRSGAFVRVTDDISPLVAVDTDNCVSYPDPATPDGSAGGWVRIEYLGGHADINVGWCGFGESGATPLQNANRLQTGINVAAQQVETLVVNKRYAATARASTPSGSYTVRPGIVIAKHGVTVSMYNTTIFAESGVAGAVISQGDTSGTFTGTNRSVIEGGTLIGDHSANFQYDGTSGQIGIEITNCYFNCEINNVDVQRFDTCVLYNESWGFVANNINTFSCGDLTTPSADAGCLVIKGGTASTVNGGRFEYCAGLANIFITGEGPLGTAAMTLNDIICQNSRTYCLRVRDAKQFAMNNGDFENNANFDDDASDVYIERTDANASDMILISGTNFTRTGSPSTVQAPVIKTDDVRYIAVENVRAVDAVDADYTALLQIDGDVGSYRVSGRYKTDDVHIVVNIVGSVENSGCIEIEHDQNGVEDPVHRCTGMSRLQADELFGGLVRFEQGPNLTITNGEITPTHTWHKLYNEGGAGTDDLNTINNCVAGNFLRLSSATSSQDPTVKNGVDNIKLESGAGDFTMGGTTDVLDLFCNGAAWVEVGKYNNAN